VSQRKDLKEFSRGTNSHLEEITEKDTDILFSQKKEVPLWHNPMTVGCQTYQIAF
jgi:hypothetical protein